MPKIKTKALDRPLKKRTMIKKVILSCNPISSVVIKETTIDIKKTNFTLFLKIERIDNSEPHK